MKTKVIARNRERNASAKIIIEGEGTIIVGVHIMVDRLTHIYRFPSIFMMTTIIFTYNYHEVTPIPSTHDKGYIHNDLM